MENELAAQQPEQTTAAPEKAESAPATTVETPKTDNGLSASEPEWFTRRFGEITARMRSEEREKLTAIRERDEARAELAKRGKAAEPVKTLQDFGYDETKFHTYMVEQAREAARSAAAEADNERQSKESAARRHRKFQEREVAFEKETKDYREVAHFAPISDRNAELLQDMEMGPELAYHLGKNREIALSLNELPPHMAAYELGQIAGQLKSAKAAKAAELAAAKAAKAVTQAPEPTSTLEGAGDPSTIKPDEASSDKLSDAEWLARRNKQVAKQRR